jgi:NDP-sugar pyrophosphorylase family protein
MSPESVDVLILAGGLGTRLRETVPDRPKVLAPVLAEPYLFHLLRYLQAQSFRRVVLLLGHRADEVITAVGTRFGTLEVAYSVESSPLGTGGAVRHALPQLQSESFLVLNGDSFCAGQYSQLISTTQPRILVTTVADTSRYGAMEVDASSRVRTFREKDGVAKPGLINAGVYGLQRLHVNLLPSTGPASLERELLPLLAARGELTAVLGGRFIDIGTPASYREAQTFFHEAADGVAV